MTSPKMPGFVSSLSVYVLLLNLNAQQFTDAALTCPNTCSDHGSCSTALGLCTCYSGFTGPDCSLRECPRDTPWVAVAIATDSARSEAMECSNAGTCDTATGVCECDSQFEGIACNILSCPLVDGETCAGRGKCISMSEFAETADLVTSFVKTDYSLWDAEKIYGCVCEPPYFGYDCSLTACSTGDDPSSTLTSAECNGRGSCDYETGSCNCEDGYSSSTSQNDCAVKDDMTVAACPQAPASREPGYGGIELTGTCSNHGFCNTRDSDKSKYCQCHTGWTNYVCDHRTCPTGRAWFDEATDSDTAHALDECSAVGICDRYTGQCKCRM
jgi:hypothetical protein